MIPSLLSFDLQYPRPKIIDVLSDPTNRHLLNYIAQDPFGAHIFPGDIPNYTISQFLSDMNQQLSEKQPIHLWINIPLCTRRCHFCQFPTIIIPPYANEKMSQWINANIKEASLWLKHVPHLKETPIGEFNIFGGTPSLIPPALIARLLDFYKNHFNFSKNTTLRFEGSACTLTKEYLDFLYSQECTKLSFGVQSFDDHLLKLCNCSHTQEQVLSCIHNARNSGFEWISVDFIYGLLNQTVSSVESDIHRAIQLNLPGIVCTKLHLKTFSESRTGVSGIQSARWQSQKYRTELSRKGYHWPTLGEQYQMRELITQLLGSHQYTEHPTMYFHNQEYPAEKWKVMMVDQDKQYPEIAIGLGGSSSCKYSEAINTVEGKQYFSCLEKDMLPIASTKGFTKQAQMIKSIRMALSSCQPLDNNIHLSRFPKNPLFKSPWLDKFESLQDRGLLIISGDQISLTSDGKTLTEAIINTEF